ncbi:MAG: hypothetical protein ACOCWA_07090 [Bacteroidota bacterium]
MKIFLKASPVLAIALLLLLNYSCTKTEKDRGDQPVVIMLPITVRKRTSGIRK